MALLQHSSPFSSSLLLARLPIPRAVTQVQHRSLPISGRMENRFSIQCQHPSTTSGGEEKPPVVRREVHFHPPAWDHHFIESNKGSNESNKERIGDLKEQVRNMLIQTNDPLEKMIVIDAIDNLGVAYHFDEEIQTILKQIYNISEDVGDNLYHVALRFKLLRQQGYHVSCDVFEKFKDKEGKFYQSLRNDAKGLLSLYEASHHRLPGENILDEALAFTTEQLKSISPQLHPALARLVQQSLRLPLQRAMLRLQARTYITFYEEEEARNNVLLELAKLDFNYVQALHQAEVKEIITWWKDLKLTEKIPFARDRSVEGFIWGMDDNYLPQFSLGRIALGKHVTLTSIIDDIYDTYGTIEEIELFTNAIERWDLEAMDQTPEYMKPFYLALYNSVNETYYMSNENSKIGIDYLKKKWINYCKALMQEATWSHTGYIPSVEEYLSVKQVATFGFGMYILTALGMGDMVNKEGLAYVFGEPKLRRLSNEISRLHNDIATAEVDYERGTINSIRCYMKEHDVSNEQARLGIKNLVAEKWKELNQEALKPHPLPKELVKASINFVKACETFYLDGQDGHTDSLNWMKDTIMTMLVEPIPM